MPFEIVRNDIVNMQVDAIVNTANPKPIVGYGVDAGVHKKAGPELLEARKKIGRIGVGEVAITPGFNLDAKYVIHAVGPIWQDGTHNEEKYLKQCYDRALQLALENGCESIAFPLLSAGNHGFPKPLALQTAINAFSSFLMEHEMQIYLVVFSLNAFELSSKLFHSVESYIDDNYILDKTLQNWMRSLPEYTKKFKIYLENGEKQSISPSTTVVRSELLKFDINSRELLFNVWLTKLSVNEDFPECYGEILKVKELLDSHLVVYRSELTKMLTAMFTPGYQGGLSHSVMAWYKRLPDATKQHVFDTDANALLSTASMITTYDDTKLLDSLVSIFVSIAIEDWNDSLADSFIKGISDAIGRINDFVESKADAEHDGHISIAVDGVHVEKTFSADAITPLGKTALSNLQSVFEEYNDALEPDEKLAILANLALQVCSGCSHLNY